MTVCGYNSEMGDSIRMLARSFVRALEERAARDGRSIRDVLERETIEIPVVCSELAASSDLGARLFHALNTLALALFHGALDKEEPADFIRHQADHFVRLLAAAEAHSQSLPPPDSVGAAVDNAREVGRFAAGRLDCARHGKPGL